ncbi:Olfactory Receptor 7D4 [Manis pentadactyla]|nr:Olfactory Receptor 7D4 [Manis pentadactyla]
MEAGNSTEVPQFLLLGLSEDPALQPVLFGLFLSMYLVTVLGNLLIILAVGSDPHLHTPMYFFLSHLSFVDICFTSTTVPKTLVNIQTQSKDISYQTHHLHMEAGNSTDVSQFLLSGLSEDPELQPLLFGLLLPMYLVTVLGNLLIILAVGSDPHLHTPMYFFLSHLSCVDICFTSTTVPKMLVNIQTQSKDISYVGCLTQVYFFTVFAGLDNFLLTVMAYDR